MVLENRFIKFNEFSRLRVDRHAQYEIRAYAEIMLNSLKKWVPITYEAFMDYRVGGYEVSAKGKKVLNKLINGEKISLKKVNFQREME